MTELATRDLAWARKITERLRLQATNYQEAREKVMTTLQEAQDGSASELLGYASWTAYVSDVLGDAPLRLERDQRQELVAELAAQGLSTRAIAPIVGASVSTVKTDVQVANSGHLGVATHQTMMQVNPDTGEVEDVPARHVTGMDGNSYAVPRREKKREPERSPSTELSLVNDIRLYLGALASSPEIANLTASGKQHIIDALKNTITEIERTTA